MLKSIIKVVCLLKKNQQALNLMLVFHNLQQVIAVEE